MIGTLGIAGVGLIGGSIGMAARHAGFAERVIGIGRNVERLLLAEKLGAVDCHSTDFLQGASQCDLLYLAAPVRVIIEQVHQLATSGLTDVVVTDGGSTKGAIMAAAAHLPDGISFVGGHPMAGSHESGVEAARPDLFRGATYVLCQNARSTPASVELLTRLVEACGASLCKMDDSDHDRAVARTSHLPHVLAGAVLRVAAGLGEQGNRLSAGSFRDITRVAESPPEVWRDICLTNAGAIREAIAQLTKELGEFEAALGDAKALEGWFEQSRRLRTSLYPGGVDR